MFTLISYDTPSNKRRRKIAQLLEGFGDRIQYSFFVAYLNNNDYIRLRERIMAIIDEDEDSICLYRLCALCRERAEYLGIAKPYEDEFVYIV